MRETPLTEFAGCGWIWYDHYGFDDANVFMMARREFTLPHLPAAAEIKITADSRYKLYVNGHYVCHGPARGYPESYPFDRVDIAPHLRRGKNVIAVLVHQYGHGTFQSIYGGAAGLLVAGKIGSADIGTKPDSWLLKKCPGHKQDMIRRTVQLGYQENFDARLVDPEWLSPETSPAAGRDGWHHGSWWRPAGCLPWLNLEERGIPLLREEIRDFRGVVGVYAGDAADGWENARNLTEVHIREQSGADAPGDSYAEVAPVAAEKHRTFIVDFGEEVAGFPGLEAESDGGEVIDFTTAELLRNNRLCVMDPNTGCKAAVSDRFVLRKGINRLETFSIHGFRYLALTVRNLHRPLKIRRLYVRQTAYPFSRTASFSCSDETLNRIWEMCVRTQIDCSLDAYVDCPWREQAQWWGDARVQGMNTYYLFGDMRLLRRGIKQGGQSQLSNGLTYGHFPTIAVGCVLPDFTLTWIHTHLDYYRFTGDKTLLREQFPKIEKAFGFFSYYLAAHDLLGPMPEWWVFFDWAPLYKDGYSAFFNLLYLSALRQMAGICDVLGKEGKSYRSQAARMEQKIIRYFWSEKDGCFYDGFDPRKKKVVKKTSQHAHALAILLGLKPEHHRKFATRFLLPPMRKEQLTDKKIIEASPFFYFYVLNALTSLGGCESEIISFIRKRWGRMLDEGSTTCHESWNPQPGYTSLCHAWSAHPVVHLTSILAGLTPLAPGWREFRLAPCPGGPDRVDCAIPAASGDIVVKLRRTGKSTRLQVRVPPGSRGRLELDGLTKKLKPGDHAFTI